MESNALPSALSSLGLFRLQPETRPRDIAFPLGLGEAGVHEVCETSYGDMPALTGFALAARTYRPGTVFWITQHHQRLDHGALLQGGMPALSAAPPKLVSAVTSKGLDALWTVEEAIRSNAVAAVIAEIEDMDFTASRRLALASARHGVPLILLMPYTREGATAASARWRVRAHPSAPNPYDARAPGWPRWQAVLERSRQAPHMAGQSFDLELNDETLSLSVVSGLAADPSAAGKASFANRFAPPANPEPETRQTRRYG
ncbi:MAG: hypothetical protein QNI84_09800 [Henriciella sp.]|nr:hypothetical protein [Henriciella sp.]